MLNTCCIHKSRISILLDFRFCVQRVLQACLVSLVLAWNEIYSARRTGRCETQDLQLCINIVLADKELNGVKRGISTGV